MQNIIKDIGNIYLKFFGHDDKTQLGLAFQRGLLLLFLFIVT